MNTWTHSICEDCWFALNPDRAPVHMVDVAIDPEPCCSCGEMHRSGIYVRQNPAELRCKGEHAA